MRLLIFVGALAFIPFHPSLGSSSFAFSHIAISQELASTPTPSERQKDFEEFADMREFWFTVKPSEAGVKPSAEFPNVFSVIMDWPIQSKTSGVIQVLVGAVSDGTSSLYLSPGSKVLGGYSAKDQALSAVKIAEQIYHAAKNVSTHPLPPSDEVYFYIRSYNGLFVLREKLSDLLNGRGKTFNLFEAMNRIMTIHLDSVDRVLEPKTSLKSE